LDRSFFNYILHTHEDEADHFAVDFLRQTEAFVSSLYKLHKENISNLLPHPIFSVFYDSHPTLREREIAILCLPFGNALAQVHG
jgi:STE24 endopeptidase